MTTEKKTEETPEIDPHAKKHPKLDKDGKPFPPVHFKNISAQPITIAKTRINPGEVGLIPGRFVAAVRASSVGRSGKHLTEDVNHAMPAPMALKVPSALLDLPETKALAVIRLCTDTDKLREWANGETRETILNAIVVRAEALTKKP